MDFSNTYRNYGEVVDFPEDFLSDYVPTVKSEPEPAAIAPSVCEPPISTTRNYGTDFGRASSMCGSSSSSSSSSYSSGSSPNYLTENGGDTEEPRFEELVSRKMSFDSENVAQVSNQMDYARDTYADSRIPFASIDSNDALLPYPVNNYVAALPVPVPAKKSRGRTAPRTPKSLETSKPGRGVKRPASKEIDAKDLGIGDLSAHMNRQIGDDEELDTQLIAHRILDELKEQCIPQASLAVKVLGRSQGTLSDLLRKPKPWGIMKNGRGTFQRMANWLDLDPVVRRALCFMKKEDVARITGMAEPTPAKRARQTTPSDERIRRFTFTQTQLDSLHTVFQQQDRPNREMQQALSATLKLNRSTVGNFFMNARRRLPKAAPVSQNLVAEHAIDHNQPGPSHHY